MIIAKPTWSGDVRPLFTEPFWIAPESRRKVVSGWLSCMKDYNILLDDFDSVRQWSVTIYNHLASRSMPLTRDDSQFWPLEALETLRLWINQGCRENTDSPFDRAERIPVPEAPGTPSRVRQDIRALSEDELNAWRAVLDDVMKVGDPDPGSPWQRWAYIHTNWCLHYQEAFALWHRAYLMYLEELTGMAVPYWDWMGEDASVDGSPQAGLPQAFLDETYIHPGTGKERPNPLRYAGAKDGWSKKCQGMAAPGDECRYVQRNPLFYTSGDEHRRERERLFGMSRLFQKQVVDALQFNHFSEPQGSPGMPWANIPEFNPPQPDQDYPYRSVNFDGLFEQPHDNYHGWIGPDMADNAYTAFDPLFLSYHANIDRILEQWIRQHRDERFTTQFPLQPFIGPRASDVNYSCPDHWRYTSMGEMAQDCRRLGYDYGPPVAPQFSAELTFGAWVVFDGVRCTYDSYAIDIFLNAPDAAPADAHAGNPHYVGRFSRIGMGLRDDKGRCITHTVSRVLNAARAMEALGLRAGDSVVLTTVVTDLSDGRRLSPEEYRHLPGFTPRLVRGDPRRPLPMDQETASCCQSESQQ